MKYQIIAFALLYFLKNNMVANTSEHVTLYPNSINSHLKTKESPMHKLNHSEDSLIMVSQHQFDSLLVSAISVLSNHSFLEIKECDHINIIRLINTIHYNKLSIPQYIHDEKFMKLIKEMEYERQLARHYNWTPNKGIGMYFPELDIELGGTPNSKSIYTLSISPSPRGGDRE